MEDLLAQFSDFDDNASDASFDDEELLEAYTHTFRSYSHGVTLDRYVNTDTRQLPINLFSRVVLSRITDIIDRGLVFMNITLQFISDTNTPIYRSLTPEALSRHEDLQFVMEEDDAFAQLTHGSDKYVNEADAYHLSTSYFEVTSAGHTGGGNVKTAMYGRFVTMLNTSLDGFDCAFDCFAHILEGPIQNIPKIRKFLGVRPFADIPYDIIPKIAILLRTTACVYEDMVDYTVGSDKSITIHGLKLLAGDKDAKIKLVLKNRHYYVLVKELDEDTQLDMLRDLVHEKQIVDPLVENRDDVMYMFFDYETVICRKTRQAVPYCFSYIIHHGQRIEKHVIYRTDDSDEDMVLFLQKIGELFSNICSNNKCRKYLIGFNNSGFDNFLLVQQAIYSNLPIKKVMVDAGNKLLSMTMSHFKVFDLYRVLMSSLKAACKGFQIKKHKLELKHEEIQDAYYRGEFSTYFHKHEREILDYSLRDVESLMELFFKVKKVVADMTSLVLEDELTAASMTYKAFLATLDEETKENLPIVDLKLDTTIRKATVGGRTQVFRRGMSKGKVRCIDVTSLYPYIMMTREYPLGQPIRTNKFQVGKIGVYNVTIHSQPADKIIPMRNKDSLDWEYSNVFDTWVTQEDIRIMRKFGATFAVISGYYWKDSSNTIFSPYLGPLMAEKMRQDVLKDAEDEEYNAALREMDKLWMNAISGKVNQRVFTEEKRFCMNDEDVERCLNNLSVKTLSSVGNIILVAGDIKHPTVKVPSIYGVLTYSYARSYMYENFISKSKTKLAMDTDSLFYLDEEHKLFLENYKELFGIQPGQMKEELGPNMYGIFVAKKFYIIFGLKSELTEGQMKYLLGKGAIERETEIIQKVRWKGVHDTDRVILDEDMIALAKEKKLTDIQLFNLYYYWSHGNFTKGGEKYDLENNPNIPFKCRHDGTLIEYEEGEGHALQPMGRPAYDTSNFRELCDGKEMHVLCNQLRKNIMDSKLSDISINGLFLVKKFA